MYHNFDIRIATEYGIEEAILLNYLYFWIKKNEANDTNYYENRYWTYNSTKALKELFPYMSESKIKRVISNLKDKGLIMTGNFNKSSYDRTLWYALTDLGNSIVQNEQMESNEMTNENGQNGLTIPVNKPVIRPVIRPVIKEQNTFFENNEELNELFNEFLIVRKKKKAVNSERAINMLLNKLNKYNDSEKKEMLERSIVNSWKDIYEIKGEEKVKAEKDKKYYFNEEGIPVCIE